MSGAFDDEDIIHVEGNVDPVRDIEIIHEELRLKDEELIAPIIDKLEKTAVRGGDKKLKPEYVSKVCVCVCVCLVLLRTQSTTVLKCHFDDCCMSHTALSIGGVNTHLLSKTKA